MLVTVRSRAPRCLNYMPATNDARHVHEDEEDEHAIVIGIRNFFFLFTTAAVAAYHICLGAEPLSTSELGTLSLGDMCRRF